MNILSPILYATYNSLLAFPVIYQFKSRPHKRKLKIGVLIASILVFILLSLINTIILSNSSSQNSQMPLLKVTESHLLRRILILCTFLEILTTVLANYIGLCYSIKNLKVQLITIFAALLFGLNDFKNLLRSLYSFMGYIGIGVIVIMFLSTFSEERQPK